MIESGKHSIQGPPLNLLGPGLFFDFIPRRSDMMRPSSFSTFFTVAIIGILTGVIAFCQPSWAGGLQSGLEQSEFSSTRHIQSALAELAQGGGKRGACFQAGSVEKCAACCRDFMTACIDLVVALCHQGDPNRAEFRHCVKNKENRCTSDSSNCAWLCRRAK